MTPNLRRLGRFSLVGAGGVVVNNATLVVLHGGLGLPLLPATVAAVELALVTNYVLHELWTFRQGRRGSRLSLQRFAYFSLAGLAALPVNVVAVQLLVALGMHYLPANLIGIVAGFAVNFAVSSKWIWSERTDGTAGVDHSHPDLAGADGAGGACVVPHDLHVGPAGGRRQGAGARSTCYTNTLLHRHPPGTARGGGHPAHHRPRRVR
ncbi:GtrA family protein [Dactylosporangium aurantiacum]|uniref:GtrA family protein n=1 Tax=Dactylosporangium aurantiacum TaxID=35754 RepID=A0A9Q9IBD2_9ACTN|nr:GtrA family protein [Dactylosporangium aurantiacum]UWZ52922.1 GtrA family protein [Dactylosporangium aurantiacum]